VRVTAQTKSATRKRILQAARRLFASQGFDAATTRDVAEAAGIASGTLFNYFASREALVAALANEAIGDALDPPAADAGRHADTLEEDLFARRRRPAQAQAPAQTPTFASRNVTQPACRRR